MTNIISFVSIKLTFRRSFNVVTLSLCDRLLSALSCLPSQNQIYVATVKTKIIQYFAKWWAYIHAYIKFLFLTTQLVHETSFVLYFTGITILIDYKRIHVAYLRIIWIIHCIAYVISCRHSNRICDCLLLFQYGKLGYILMWVRFCIYITWRESFWKKYRMYRTDIVVVIVQVFFIFWNCVIMSPVIARFSLFTQPTMLSLSSLHFPKFFCRLRELNTVLMWFFRCC